MTLDEAFNTKSMHNGQWKRFKVPVLSVTMLNAKQTIDCGREGANNMRAPHTARTSERTAFAASTTVHATVADKILHNFSALTIDEAFNAKQMHNGQWKRFKVAVLSVDTLNAKQTIDGGQKGAKNEQAIFKVPVLSVSMLN
jgi:hypothetical protein